MGKDIQKSCVRVGHGRTLVLSQLHVIHTGRQISTTNQIEPLLDFVFVDEPCFITLALCGEEDIQIKFVELALLECF